ncbi:auxin-responsive protein IAA16-like [Primulina huaijiensis]|uniref:auxin-responsive protein IAA16-like n=1 Tax=Primulina huaijiensis TaxID=1492673 RepID=UPI003CC788B1
MKGFARKGEGCPQLMDLIPRKGWLVEKSAEETKNHGLELTLGPPSGDWKISKEKSNESPLSFTHFSNDPCLKNQVLKYPLNQPTMAPFMHLQLVHQQIHGGGRVTVMKEESSQPCNNRAGEDFRSAEIMKGFSPDPADTAVANRNSAQKRTASPVVGWPPIRSFRKNLTNGTSSKPASESLNTNLTETSGQKPNEDLPKSSLFVKINMDGVPIGRKVDLKAYDSYEKLSIAVDELFTGLLAAQREACGVGIKYKDKGGNGTRGHLLDESGEYTLVYEDNEGDRMLVGDVPWHMFVSTVKRLRVLKSSQLPLLSLDDGSKKGRLSTE